MQQNPNLRRKRARWDHSRKCHFCGREFSKTEHLERHVRSHTKEKPFSCPQCDRKYGRHDSLLRHIKDQHNAQSNHGQDQATPSLPAGELVRMPAINGEGEDIDMTQANPEVSVMSNLNALPVASLPEGNSLLSFEDWLDGDNVIGFLHDWPFGWEYGETGVATDIAAYSHSKPCIDLQQRWYTHLDNDDPAVSGTATPIPRHNEVDDNYRQSLHRRLQIRSIDDKLPSADFLNLCVRCYFKKFHRLFPVVHAPTFRPSKTKSVLLLSICSIGSLLTGYPSAVQRGIQLFERLHKAILAHWEKLMRHGPDETLAMIQASLVGQTFGLLSGQAKHLALVDAFHGTVISWARRTKILEARHSDLSEYADLDSKWRNWIRTEEKIRVALGLRIHDAEIANLLHHETLLPSASKVLQNASDVLFFASTAQEWYSLYCEYGNYSSPTASDRSGSLAVPEHLHQRLQSIPADCPFTIYTALESVSSSIIGARVNDSLSSAFVETIQDCLIAVYRQHLSQAQFEPLRHGGKILWHYLFISLHADLDLLERSIGRDGIDLDPTDLARVHKWATSTAAQRCVAHAVKIKKIVESLPLTTEPGVHAPRVMFSSAICLLCYTKYGGDGGRAVVSEGYAHFPELEVQDMDVALLLREAKGDSSREVEVSPIYGLVDLLQRIGHWEISRSFASILGVLLQAESG